MRDCSKVILYNRLGLMNLPSQNRRPGFSLAELVISIGVLVLMMGLAGQVFSITIKSTGQATALTEITQQIRVFEETLREDLRNVEPGQSIMLIEGNPVNAYWSQLGKESDDNDSPKDGYGFLRDPLREKVDANGNAQLESPRADVLMFFTARTATSQVNPAVSSRVQQVVYSHANLGEYSPDPTQEMTITQEFSNANVFGLSNGAVLLPAQQWHLGRRSVLVLPNGLGDIAGAVSWNDLVDSDDGLGIKSLVDGEVDIVSDFRFEDIIIRPFDPKSEWDTKEPWYLPAVFGDTSNSARQEWHKPSSRSLLDSNPPAMMANRMGSYFLPHCASFKVEWSLDPRSPFVNGRLDGTTEVFWIDPGYDSGTPDDPSDDDPLHALRARFEALEDADACSNKKHPQHRFCINLSSLLCEQTSHGDDWPPGNYQKYSLSDRFVGRTCNPIGDGKQLSESDSIWPQLSSDGRKPNVATFTALRPGASGGFVTDDIWPSALRITIDLYDREGRLERPIRHVMVIPVGG